MKLMLFPDLSSIPNASSANEEPENLEVKPLTPSEPYSVEADTRQDSRRGSSLEPHPSTFAFPSEDEPVTMISKSIPPSAMSMSRGSSRSTSRRSGEGMSKGRFTRYNSVACDMLTTSLGHKLLCVNQTYNLLAIVTYDKKNVVSF